MNLETYVDLTRYLTSIVFSFFVYQFLLSVFNFYDHREKGVFWHTMMCFSTASYCFIFAFNTHFFTQKISNFNLIIFWLFAYSSYYCYLRAIEDFLGHSIRMLKFSKTFCLFFCLVQVLCAISYSIFDFNFLFNFHDTQIDSLFGRAMHFKVSPNLYAKFLGGFGAFVVFFSSSVIWLELNRLKRREPFLRIGLILTFLVVINDSALGLEITGAILPLYYLGNAFEAVRFNLHYQAKSNQKLYGLENEVVKLSRIAQFGFAAASISHDIANHLSIIKMTISKLLTKTSSPELTKKYELIAKHNSKIEEISKLYMNLFNKTSARDKEVVSSEFIVNEALELVEPIFKDSNVKLDTHIEDFKIECNSTEISLCLVNILKNSLQEVTISGKYDGPWVEIISNSLEKTITITDCGNGIDEVTAKSIFEIGNSTRIGSGGHGIGLAITKQLLINSNFQIDIDHDSPNTSFVISFE